MTKFLFITLFTFLFTPAQAHPFSSDDCLIISYYLQDFAILRDIGITQDDLFKLIKAYGPIPPISDDKDRLTLAYLVQSIYQTKKSPEEIHQTFLRPCRSTSTRSI